MGMKTVAIIGALDEEVALIAKSLTHVTHTAKGSLDTPWILLDPT